MGFKSLLENQVQGLMKTLGQQDGLAPTQTYVVKGAPIYDPVTRSNTSSDTYITGVPMVLAGFTVEEMDSSIVIETDCKAIIAALDLPNVTPKEQDDIIVGAGANVAAGTYEVMKVKGVPGRSVHILHIRRNG